VDRLTRTAKKSTGVRGLDSVESGARKAMYQEVSGTVRAMPEDLASEAAVLGSMIVDPICISEVVEKLKREDFYRQEHRIIWDALIALYEKNKGIGVDAVLVRSELGNYKQLDEAGGVEYINKLMNTVPSSANVMYYAAIVKDKAMLRELIRTTSEILEDAYAGAGETAEKLDLAEQKIFEVADRRTSSSATPLKDLLMQVYERIEKRDGKHVTGIATGYHELDQLMCGLQNGEMIIIAGRPSMGKTSFAMNIAEHMGVVDKIPVAIFSLEMSNQQLAERFLSSKSKIDAQNIKRGRLSDEHYKLLIESCDELSSAPIYIDDMAAMTPLELRAKTRRLKKQYGIKCVIVDYMQLMSCGAGRVESRQQEVTLISRHLKALAKELDVPVVVLSQLNRALEGREDHRPRMSDLRESGSIEQDADVVILLHREDYYHSKKIGSAREEGSVYSSQASASSGKSGAGGSTIVSGGGEYEHNNKAEVIVAKQRNGPTDTVELLFFENTMRFENPSHMEEPF